MRPWQLLVGILLLITTPIAVQAREWAKIKERDRLIVGVKQNFPPLGFQDDGGRWQGFEIDIARQLAYELLGSAEKVDFVPLSNSDRLPALWEDRVDMVIAQVTVTGNRRRLVDFSPAYYTDGTFLVYSPKTPIKALSQPKVGVLKDSATIAVLQFQLPKAITVGVDSYSEGWQALQEGKIDAFAGDGTAMIHWLSQNPQFQRSEQPLYHHSLAIALPRGLQYDELRQQVFRAIEKLKNQGWLDRKANSWGLP